MEQKGISIVIFLSFFFSFFLDIGFLKNNNIKYWWIILQFLDSCFFCSDIALYDSVSQEN